MFANESVPRSTYVRNGLQGLVYLAEIRHVSAFGSVERSSARGLYEGW